MWHLENGRTLQLLKSIPHLYRNDCGVDLRGRTLSTSSSLLSRQFGLMSVSRQLSDVPSSIQFLHEIFWIYNAFFSTVITAPAALTRICSSTVLWHTHTQHNIMLCFHSWVAETIVNLELNNSSRKGREPLDYHAWRIGNDWTLHEHFMPCSLGSPFGHLPVVARDWEFIVF